MLLFRDVNSHRVYSLSNMLGNTGGLLNTLLIVGGIISSYFTNRIFNATMLSTFKEYNVFRASLPSGAQKILKF